MQVVLYPHPALRHCSRPLKRVDSELRGMIREMFDLMYEHNGVGLAANQVNLPYRVFVVNEQADPAAKDQERVFINPVLNKKHGTCEEQEGCLSVPGLYAPVKRPEKVTVTAYDLQGREFRLDLSGMSARIVQHEYDHLDGILFTDKLSPANLAAAREALEEFEIDFHGRRQRGEIPSDEEIAAQLKELEAARC